MNATAAANLATPTPGSVKPLNTRQLAKAATRGKVLEAAKTCFELLGYERADMRSIADYARVSTGAIFGHFSGKAELYREVYGHDPISPEVGRELLEALKAVMPGRLIGESFQTPVPDKEVLREFLFTWGQLRAARAAIALATTPSEGSGSSVAESGGTASPKSDSSEGH